MRNIYKKGCFIAEEKMTSSSDEIINGIYNHRPVNYNTPSSKQ